MEFKKRFGGWSIPIVQVVILFVGMLPMWNALQSNLPTAFARQGAFLVAMGVTFTALNGRDLIQWQINESLGVSEAKDYKWLRIANWVVTWFLLFGGTLIWGYGDQFVCEWHAEEFGSC